MDEQAPIFPAPHSQDAVERLDCPGCLGKGCEQCDGYGYIYKVPNHLGSDEAKRQIDALEGRS